VNVQRQYQPDPERELRALMLILELAIPTNGATLPPVVSRPALPGDVMHPNEERTCGNPKPNGEYRRRNDHHP
jgi:hypothetical protein